MTRTLPRTLDQWLKEILLAWKEARETKPYGHLTGTRLTDADLFHLAPLFCLEYRGRKLTGREAERVTQTTLANLVVNREKGLEAKPPLAFALCYVAAHLVLDLVDEQTAEEIMNFCEERFPV